MMNKMKLFALIPLFLIIFSCETKESLQKRMSGINGNAVYVFNKGGSIKAVFKEKFNNHNFAILLLRDTIFLGSDFKSSIYVADPNHRIEIISPSAQLIVNESKSNDFKSYQFKPEREGIYNFIGIIKYDTVATPFDYKFIVVKKD